MPPSIAYIVILVNNAENGRPLPSTFQWQFFYQDCMKTCWGTSVTVLCFHSLNSMPSPGLERRAPSSVSYVKGFIIFQCCNEKNDADYDRHVIHLPHTCHEGKPKGWERRANVNNGVRRLGRRIKCNGASQSRMKTTNIEGQNDLMMRLLRRNFGAGPSGCVCLLLPPSSKPAGGDQQL